MVVAKDELDMLLQVIVVVVVETTGIESGSLGVVLNRKCTK